MWALTIFLKNLSISSPDCCTLCVLLYYNKCLQYFLECSSVLYRINELKYQTILGLQILIAHVLLLTYFQVT